jgi:tellurite resistance protein TehA-like permease
VRGVHPGGFAVVMATGIVSTALRQAGQLRISAVLLAIAVAAFAVLAALSLVRGVAFPAELRADLTHPDRAPSRWPSWPSSCWPPR